MKSNIVWLREVKERETKEGRKEGRLKILNKGLR